MPAMSGVSSAPTGAGSVANARRAAAPVRASAVRRWGLPSMAFLLVRVSGAAQPGDSQLLTAGATTSSGSLRDDLLEPGGRGPRALAPLGEAPDVDEAADLPGAVHGRERAVPELDAVARARLDVDHDVRDHGVVARLGHALPARVDLVVGRIAAPAMVVPDQLPELALAVVGEGIERLHRILVDVDVLLLVGVIGVERDETELDRVPQLPAVVRERKAVGPEVVVLLVGVGLDLGIDR